jgi:hypothetical protein
MFENFKKRIAIKKAINHTELSIVERSSIVNEVTEKCFVDNNYHPEYVKPMFTLSVLRMFTTISPIMMKNEDGTDNEYVNVEKTYSYCVENHIMDYVVAKCKYMYLDDLFSEVCESIEFKKAQMIAMTSPLSALLTSIKNAVDNMDMSKAKDIIEMASKMNKAGLNDSGKIIDAIVKNAQQKDVK